MSWERSLAVLIAIATSGCSLILDFSDDAIPIDAAIDGPFTQVECDYGEPNESAAAPAMFVATEAAAAAICSGTDKDFFKVTIPTNTSVELKITFIARQGGDLDLRLYDKSGATVLAQSREFTPGETILCPSSSPPCDALPPDDYIFEVFPGLANAVNRYDIAITVVP